MTLSEWAKEAWDWGLPSPKLDSIQASVYGRSAIGSQSKEAGQEVLKQVAFNE